MKSRTILGLVIPLVYIFFSACTHFQTGKENLESAPAVKSVISKSRDTIFTSNENLKPAVIIPRDILMKEYFSFLDSVIKDHDSLVDYSLTEHILVLANSWIIDTLQSYDYYEKMKQGIFIYDQREVVILHKGDTLHIPEKQIANAIETALKNTILDVNIPEYKLRIIIRDTTKYILPVRVGRNETKYLKTAGREVSLTTPIGEGEVVRIEKNPWYINPVTGKRYFQTQRDDGKYTKLPQIPFLEPMINRIRQGALIHPTTNAHTLGKAYSNGCIGTGEGDAWIIYYHAPVGTKVRFRYELNVTDEHGSPVLLKDIYQLKSVSTKSYPTFMFPFTQPYTINQHLAKRLKVNSKQFLELLIED